MTSRNPVDKFGAKNIRKTTYTCRILSVFVSSVRVLEIRCRFLKCDLEEAMMVKSHWSNHCFILKITSYLANCTNPCIPVSNWFSLNHFLLMPIRPIANLFTEKCGNFQRLFIATIGIYMPMIATHR